jgi:parallel beta-helix repeat protein
MKPIRLIVCSGLLVVLACCSVQAATFIVPGDFGTIQGAIADAGTVNGDEIVVQPGTYFEVINFLGKAITLRSASGDPNNTIIDGLELFHVVQCVNNEDANTVLEGFTITGGNADGATPPDNVGGGMYNLNSSPTVTNCIFTGNNTNGTDSRGGGMCNKKSNPIVTGCFFIGNNAKGTSSSGGGMYNDNSNPIVTNCTFELNTTEGIGGGMDNAYSNPIVTDCTFTGNSATNNGGGMINHLASKPVVTGCAFNFNSVTYNGGGMYNFSNLTVTDCTFNSNTAYEGGGMYNSLCNTTVTNCTFSDNTATKYGGGISNYDRSNPTVTGCTFSDNTAAKNGGGMSNIDDSNPAVTDCNFIGNTATMYGGGMSNDNNCDPTVTGSTFSDNQADLEGGGMFNYLGSSPTVTHCKFINNTAINGGGLRNEAYAKPIVSNCIFSRNLSLDGTGAGMSNFNECNPEVTNCSFSDNQIVGNSSGAGGISNEETSSPRVTNTILWGNVPDQVSYDVNSIRQITYSLVQGGSTGSGNIDADPNFVNANADDLHLQAGSPAIDAGSNAAIGSPWDLDGNNRFIDDPDTEDTGMGPGEIVDMGAYEFGASQCLCDNGLVGDINCDGIVDRLDVKLLGVHWLEML